jgi:hypothetical protein
MASPLRILARAMVVPPRLQGSQFDWMAWVKKIRQSREMLYIDPRAVSAYLHAALAKQLRTRAVRRRVLLVDGEWESEVAPVDFAATSVHQSCRLHWLEGVPWQETPVFREYLERMERGAIKRFATPDDLLARYRSLDEIYEEVRQQGRMSTSFEHLIRINIDRHGRLIVGPDGRHRHTIALIAGLERVPARLGYVHPAALPRLRVLQRAMPRVAPPPDPPLREDRA